MKFDVFTRRLCPRSDDILLGASSFVIRFAETSRLLKLQTSIRLARCSADASVNEFNQFEHVGNELLFRHSVHA